MSVFAVIAGKGSARSLADKIASAYSPDAYISIDNGNWLVFEPELLPPKSICDKIIGENDVSHRLMVIPVEAYWGVHDNKIWAWLGSKNL